MGKLVKQNEARNPYDRGRSLVIGGFTAFLRSSRKEKAAGRLVAKRKKTSERFRRG